MAIAGEYDFHGTSRFQVQRRLGEGGMGVVYEAFDRQRQSVVALKTLRTGDAQRLFRLKAEFRALADLEHQNLVRLGELICEDGQWFFTMDLVNGVDFMAYVRGRDEASADGASRADTELDSWGSGGRTDGPGDPPRWERGFHEQRLRSVLGQLCRGVSALHAAHKVHRDIKPSNILVTPEGRAVLLDFGLVADLAGDGPSTEFRTVVGTAPYMAPEQAASRVVGPQADWYSVGVLLYEALAGQRPFLGRDLEVLLEKQHTEPPSPLSLFPEVPADLNALCMELLRIEPTLRPTGAMILERLGVQESPEKTTSPTISSPFTQAPSFVGRKQELASLRRAFEDCQQGHAVTFLVSGESGLGKSALVRQFLDELKSQHRALVFVSRCYERESLPFKAFDGIVDALSRHLGRLDAVDAALLLPADVDLVGRLFPVLRWVPVVGRVMPGRHHVASPQELRTRAFAALRELLTRIVQRRQLVLFVDDLQWADADSLALLSELLHPEDAPHILLVATVRAGGMEAGLTPALADVVAKIGDVRRLELACLSVEETCTLVASLLDGTGDRASDAQAIARETSGHPLFVQELVRHVQRKGGVETLGTIRLDDALRERIDALDAPARHLLQVVAVAGAPIAQDVVVRAAELDPKESGRWISLLRIANVVRTRGTRGSDAIETYHDRIREAVIARLPSELRQSLHYRLADAIEQAGLAVEDPRILVSHLEAAGDAPRAAVHAERAARLAADQLAFDQAAELYRTALRLGQYGAADIRRLNVALGETLIAEGRGPEAAEAYLLAAEGADSATRLDCHRRAAEQLLLSGYHERGLSTLGAVLAEVGVRLPRTPRRALLSLIWQRIRLRLRGLSWREGHLGAPAPADLRRLDVYQGVAAGLAMVDTIRGADFQARCLLLALRLGERRSIGRALAMEAVFLCSQGGKSLARGRLLAAKVGQIAEASQDSYLRGYALTGAGMGSFFAGDFQETARLLGAAETTLQETAGTVWELSSIRLFRLLALRHVGALGELGRTFDEYVRDAARRGDRYAETTLTRMFNWVWLAKDAPAEAHRDLAQKPWTPPERGFHVQHWYELRARVELELYEGKAQGAMERHGERFRSLSRSMLLRVQTIRADALWLRGRVLLVGTAKVPGQAALTQVSRLATKLAREGVGYAQVWGLLLGATVAYQKHAPDDAQALLSRAIEWADANHLALLGAAARLRLGPLRGGQEGAELRAQGEAWMATEGIRNPARMIDVVLPGFGQETGSMPPH